MYLTRWEEKALSGEFGEALRISMEVLVKVCRSLKAERLVEISHAHVSGVSYFNIGDEGLELLEDLATKGARVSVYTTANPASVALLDIFSTRYSSSIVDKQRRVVELLIKMGVESKSFTCAPYKLRYPSYGEHLAWAESSAVIYANSVVGARTNREGGVVALMAAIAGRTCYCGLHLDENRRLTEYIEVEFPVDSIALASALGLYIGRITRGVPYIKLGIKLSGRARDIAIRSMLASIATTSSSAMALIEGVSPEAKKSLSDVPGEKISIELRDIRRLIEDTCSNTLYIGCPHIDVDEAKEILNILSKTGGTGIEKIYTTIPYYEFEYLTRLSENVGGVEVVYLPGVCLVVSDLSGVMGRLATIHGKARHYIPRLAGVESCLIGIA